MHWLYLLIFVFGIIWSGLTYAEGEDVEESAQKRGMVLVEPLGVATSTTDGQYRLLPYRERRNKWGYNFSLGYSTYEPLNYEPDVAAEDFSTIYGYSDLPLIELQFVVKRNFPFGSVGLSVGVGIYENQSGNVDFGESTLQLIPVKVGAVLSLETLMKNPYVVPYVGGGVYTMIFDESLGGNSHNGNTEAAPYYHGGLAFLLEWIDPAGAMIAYRDSGIIASYAFVEMQKYMPAQAKADGDFSNDISYAGGLRVEF